MGGEGSQVAVGAQRQKRTLVRMKRILTLPAELTGIAERRPPARRASGGFSILAGSETGAPGQRQDAPHHLKFVHLLIAFLHSVCSHLRIPTIKSLGPDRAAVPLARYDLMPSRALGAE